MNWGLFIAGCVMSIMLGIAVGFIVGVDVEHGRNEAKQMGLDGPAPDTTFIGQNQEWCMQDGPISGNVECRIDSPKGATLRKAGITDQIEEIRRLQSDQAVKLAVLDQVIHDYMIAHPLAGR